MKTWLLKLRNKLFGNGFGATSVLQVFQGGTGLSKPNGILYGDNSGTNPLSTVVVGSGLSFTGGTLAATGGGSGTPGGLNTQLQYNNAGAFGGITGAVTDGTAVSLTAPHLLNPTINGAGTGLATLVYPNTSSNATITVPATTGTLALTSQLTTGTVTTVSVVTANGFAGTVATATSTPAITLTTSITGVLKGNGTAISAGVAGDVDSILPTQTGNSGKVLSTNGTNSSWIAAGGTGTVTSVTSADANATVATTTTTPVITIVSAPKWATARNLAGNSVDGSANVAFANKFIVQGTTDAGLSGAQFLGALGTGIVKNTTTTGVLSIAVAADFPTLNQNTTGSAATLTTPRAINGVNFDGSAAITITAAAGTLTGTTLNSTVVASSLTSLGSSASLPGSPTTTTQTPADNSTKIATTAYVDNAVLGQNYKEAALVATTANLVGVYVSGVFTYTATGTDNIDGVNLALGNRVLVKNQTTTFQNGIYVVTTAGSLGVAGVLTRSSDANTSGEFKTGDALFVISGTVNASTTWVYTGVDSPTLGTDAITYVQAAGLGTYVAGNGLSLTGNSFAIDTSITVDKTTAQTLTNKSIVATQLTGTLQAGQFPALTGDITTTAGALATTLATVNSNVGSFTNANVTVNAKGLITAASNGTAGLTTLTVGTTTITSGTTTRMLYDNGGVLGETTGITTNGTVATLTTPVLTGLPTGTGVAATPTVSTLAARDANGNLSAINFIDSSTITTTAAGTTVLTVGSANIQIFGGSTTQTVTMPVTSTLVVGQQWYFLNLSTGAVTINSSGGNAIVILAGLTAALMTCTTNSGTTNTSWTTDYKGVSAASSKKAVINNSLTFSGTDATTMTFPTTSATIARTDVGQTFTGTNAFGVITATTLNGNAFTAGTYTLTGAAGKTLTFNNSITLAGTDSTTMTFPSTSATIARTDAAQTFTGTQTFGAAVVTTLNGNTFTAGTYTLTGTAAKTLNFTNTLTLSGTDGTTMTFPSTTATIARTDAAQTFTGVQTFSSAPVLSTSTITVGAGTNTLQAVTDTVVYRATTDTLNNKNIQRRLVTVSGPGATPTTTLSTTDIANFTGIAANITNMSTNLNPLGGVDGQLLEYRFIDNGTAKTIAWGTSFTASTVALPTTTVASTTLRVLFEYNGTTFVCIAVA